MKASKVLAVVLVLFLLVSCSKVMMMVGKFAAGALTEKSGEIENITPFVKMVNFNRPRPILSVEKEYVEKAGKSYDEVGSHVSMLLSRGMKFIEVDGAVQCNNENMDYWGTGMYSLLMDISGGDRFNFYLKGVSGQEFSFEEAYRGQKLEILSPKEGETINILNGFDIEWTAGNDSEKMVLVSLRIKQLGIESFGYIATVPDVGKYTLSPQILGEKMGTGVSIDVGPNTLILERRDDEIRYILNEDAIISSVDADAVPINIEGSKPKAESPVIKAFNVKKGDVEINVGAVQQYGNMAFLKDIDNVALTSFVFKGKTYAVDSKTETRADGVYKVTIEWTLDMGEDNLHNIVETITDQFMDELTNVLGANEVPTSRIVNTKGYERMKKVESGSDPAAFYMTARGLTAFDGLHQFKVKIGGTESWYYDIQKASGADALFEVYLTLNREQPKEVSDLTFNIEAEVATKVFPNKVVERCVLPSFTAKWKSETFEWKQGAQISEFIKAVKFRDFTAAFIEALKQLKEKQEALNF